jgi:hypothetical protein
MFDKQISHSIEKFIIYSFIYSFAALRRNDLPFPIFTTTKLIFFLSMNSEIERLVAMEKEIDQLSKQRKLLRQKELRSSLTAEEEIDLNGIEKLLANKKESKKFHEWVIAQTIRKEPEVKSFQEADIEWISLVTEVDTDYRRLTTFTIDESIKPRPGFETSFNEIKKAFHMLNRSSRRLYLELFLMDIVVRAEFEGVLRIFPEIELSAQTEGFIRRKIQGISDYTIGLARQNMGIFCISMPRELSVVVSCASTKMSHEDQLECVAQMAVLYKVRVDDKKEQKSVWGILSDATRWQFLYIDEDGKLWCSETFFTNIQQSDETKTLFVYRVLYFILKQCYERCRAALSSPDPVV